MNIPRVGAKLFLADRQTGVRTDMKKIIIAFRNLANAPKNHMYRWLEMITSDCSHPRSVVSRKLRHTVNDRSKRTIVHSSARI